MRQWKQSSCVRALIISSLGLGCTACMAGNSSNLTHNESQIVATRYKPIFQNTSKAPEPYVLLAQNNSVPQLRGLSTSPKHASRLPRQIYQDYPAHNFTRSDSVAKRNGPIERLPKFRHHLDETLVEFPSDKNEEHLYAGNIEPEIYRVRSHIRQESQPHNTISNASATSIDQSLRSAVDQSPRLAIEDLKIREAEEDLVQAKSQGRFKLNLEGVVGATQSESEFSVVNRNDSDFRAHRAANLDLSLPIYQGGMINAKKNIAKVGIKSAKADYDVVQSTVTQETAIAHLNVIRDRQLTEVYTRNVELLKDQKNNVQAMVSAGENTVTDQALIDARLASIQVKLEQSKANLAASSSNYKKLVGRPAPYLMPAETVVLPSSLQEIKETAQKNNAQLKAVQTRAEAAYHNVAVAKSFGRPKLSLQGVLRAAEGQSETIRRNSAAEVLLNLKVPLLSGGENKSRVRQAALAQSRAALENHVLHDDLNERLEQLWASVQSARSSMAPNQVQKQAAQKAYKAINKQRNAGLATSLDVLSVEQTLLDAEINLIEAQNIEDVSRFQLLALMGAL